jgi:hypothetical protein
MSSVTVDELVMRIEIELDRFRSQAGQAEGIERRLRGAIRGTEEASRDAGAAINEMSGRVAESNRQFDAQLNTLVTVTRRLAGFIAVIAGSNAISKFVTAISDANDQLGFMSKRLGMAARDIRGLETAVSALGGSGASVNSTIRNLNQGIQEMVLMGNDSLIPFFGALGVGVVDAAGSIRQMDDVLLDMADSLSKMNPQQAYALASAMGLDDGVANALIQGRDAMKEMLDMQKTIYVSSEAEIRASRELSRAQAFLGAQWEGFKTIIANAIIPAMLKMTKIVSGWVDYLARNERSVRNFFEGVATVIGIVLIPLLVRAGVAMLGLISPILAATAVVAGLAAAFGLLYDDYKTWAEGGKSLFNWEMFDNYINKINISVDSLAKGFAQLLTGYDSLSEAQEGFMRWLREKGIIDENGISIRKLGEAFKQLGSDIFNSMPHLRTMLEIIQALTEGRFSDAIDLAKQIPAQVAGSMVDAYGAVVGHTTGALDTMLGLEAGSEGTISGSIKSGASWLKEQISGWANSPSSQASSSIPMASAGRGFTAEKARSIERVAAEIGMAPNDLAQIISFETGGTFSPNARNPRSSATGLIQKMKDPDGKYYGYSRDELGAMSFDEQMEKVVKRYFQDRGFSDGRTKTLAQGYEAVAGSGYRRGSQAYELNSVWDTNGDGIIDKHEAVNSPQFQAHANDWMGLGRARSMTSIPGITPIESASASGGASVHIDTLTVQTSATTLPEATKEGVEAGVAKGSTMLIQLGGGI